MKITFHGGPADGESINVEYCPLERVIIESVELSKSKEEVIWFIYLYRRVSPQEGVVQYWLGDIQVADNGAEKWGRVYKEMLH